MVGIYKRNERGEKKEKKKECDRETNVGRTNPSHCLMERRKTQHFVCVYVLGAKTGFLLRITAAAGKGEGGVASRAEMFGT